MSNQRRFVEMKPSNEQIDILKAVARNTRNGKWWLDVYYQASNGCPIKSYCWTKWTSRAFKPNDTV